eukprot:c9329_g1_i1.p1 GENE.c9329_g1_i1~~c9329_g1_i1.p1  ORF type:complete len:300 (-),score=86.55 c9329_g1_i1:86-985(-)
MSIPQGCEDVDGGWFARAVKKGKEKTECQDRAIACVDLSEKSNTSKAAVLASLGELPDRMALFAVFDGHAGSECSSYLAKSTIRQFWASAAETVKSGHMAVDQFLKGCLEHMCHRLDESFMDSFNMSGRRDGSCANFVLLWGNKLACANVGDSRALINDNGHMLELSKDHKPSDPEEKARITKAGGTVSIDKKSGEARLDSGNIAISRAFGNKSVKKSWPNILIAKPEVRILDLTPSMGFCLLASDGIWCRLSSAEATQLVAAELSRTQSPFAAAQALIAEAWTRKTNDDSSVIVISLQ